VRSDLSGTADEDLRAQLTTCLAVPRWVREVMAGRPYADRAALLAAADRAAATLTTDEVAAALAGHPRIGEHATGAGPAALLSRSEQAGVDSAAAEEFVAANQEYERRFGHIYLVCAAGRGGQDLLADLRTRLGNDRDTELTVVASELRKIARQRLEKVADGLLVPRTRSAVTTHVLDTASGLPAAGVPVRLEAYDTGATLGTGVTDADGRCHRLGPDRLDAGVYRLVLDTEAYLSALDDDTPAFFPEVTVSFRISDPNRHHHVPVLLSPFSFTSYRGS